MDDAVDPEACTAMTSNENAPPETEEEDNSTHPASIRATEDLAVTMQPTKADTPQGAQLHSIAPVASVQGTYATWEGGLAPPRAM